MKDTETQQKARARGFKLIVNEEYVDPVDVAAKEFCDKVEAEFPKHKSPVRDDADFVIELPADDKVLGRAITIMNERGWNIGINEFNATSGRIGSVTMISTLIAAVLSFDQ